MKLVIVVLMSLQVASAGCINLSQYYLSGDYSRSEISDFNADKLETYRNFILGENRINSIYTAKVQKTYQLGYSDNQLKTELSRLEAEKSNKLKQHCETYKARLHNLVRSFR